MKHAYSKGRIALIVCAVLMLVFIFGQSLLSETVSADESNWIRIHIMNPLFGFFGLEPPTHIFVRKFAHVLEFAALSVLLVSCFRGKIIRSAAVGFAAAFLDESIQLLSGRGALITDVWIDLIGVAFGILLGLLFYRLLLAWRKNRQTIH